MPSWKCLYIYFNNKYNTKAAKRKT
ncbi:hypothetical protein FOXYSP1_21144 [Fusarium oxysporum f. sp. phaseoli]